MNKKRMSLNECIGMEIKKVRINNGITQAELANQAGTYQPSIAKIENGKTLPNLTFLKKIADSLGVEIKINFQ